MSMSRPGRRRPLSSIDLNRSENPDTRQQEARIALAYIQRVQLALPKDDPSRLHLDRTIELVKARTLDFPASPVRSPGTPVTERRESIRSFPQRSRAHDCRSDLQDPEHREDTDHEGDDGIRYSRIVKSKSRKGINEQKQTLRSFNRVIQRLLEAYDICHERDEGGDDAVQEFWACFDKAAESCRLTRSGVQRFREKGKGSRWHMESGFAINLPFVYFEAEILPHSRRPDEREHQFASLQDRFDLLKKYLDHAVQYHSSQGDAGVLKESEKVDWIEVNGWTGKLPKWIHREN